MGEEAASPAIALPRTPHFIDFAMADSFKYFAYGSNMCSRRLRERTPSASLVSIGIVRGKRLTFDKVSDDGSGKCSIEEGEPGASVYGVLFNIMQEEKIALDRVEGVGKGYECTTVQVEIPSGLVSAVTYIATRRDASLKPYHWYKKLVVAGAREHKLPQEYVDYIGRVESIDDPNIERANRHQWLIEGII